MGVVRMWAVASGMVSRADVNNTLGIHRRTSHSWLYGDRSPSLAHVWRMCGIMLERDRLVAWDLGATPWLTCIEWLAAETGLAEKRVRSLCRLGGLRKQFSLGATWRLFEFSVWVGLRYKPDTFAYVDWDRRTVRFQQNRHPHVRVWRGPGYSRTNAKGQPGAVLWLPTDPFDLITDPDRTEVISYEPPELTPGAAARSTFVLPDSWNRSDDGLPLLAASGQLPGSILR